MIVKKTGKIIEGLYMVGPSAMPVYLLDGEKPAVFDAGLAFLGNLYVNEIQQILGRRPLHYCFLTHSHFDHCGSIAVLKKYFPALQVVASQKAKNVLNRPNARALIGQLTRASEPLVGSIGIELSEFDPFEPFEINVTVKDGDCIELSRNLSVQIIETPGHTRDCLSYFIPQKKILLCSEAAGIPDVTGHIVCEALVDYDEYYASMNRLSRMDYEVLCLGHRRAFTGQDATNYFRKSMAHCRDFLNLVQTFLVKENGNVQKAVARIKAIEYDPIRGPKQIEPAYLLNLEAKVKAIKKRLDHKSGNLEIPN